MTRGLKLLLVTALIAPVLVLSGCCKQAHEDCYDKTSQTYTK